MKPDEKQEILETVDLAARLDKVSRLLAHRLEVLRLSHEIGRQTKASLDERQREVLLREQMAAIQQPARRRRRGQGRGNRRARQGDRQGRHARRGRGAGAQGAAPAAAHARGRRRIRHDPHLSRLADRAAVEAARGRTDRYRRGAHASSTRTISAWRRSSAASSSISRCASWRRGQGADPLLRRPARRRQDLARPVDRAGHGPQVRARQPRRRARRGRDPRPPAHLYRRLARQHHPGDPQGRRAQSRDDARRDRQDRRRHPGRSVRGAARGARSGAEQHVPRQLPGGAVRSEPRGVHRHRQHAGHHSRRRCATAWRSSASPATPPRRSWRSPSATWCAGSWRPTA